MPTPRTFNPITNEAKSGAARRRRNSKASITWDEARRIANESSRCRSINRAAYHLAAPPHSIGTSWLMMPSPASEASITLPEPLDGGLLGGADPRHPATIRPDSARRSRQQNRSCVESHQRPQSRRRWIYNRAEHSAERKVAVELWAAHVEADFSGKEPGGEPVIGTPLRSRLPARSQPSVTASNRR